MTSDNPSQPPSTESTGAHIAPAEARPEVEYDDFGLPVRKRRPRTPVEDSSDEDEFKDAVAERSKAASQVDVAAKTEDKAEAQKAVESIVEHVQEREAAEASASGTAHTTVNGQVKVEEVELGREDEDKALKGTKGDAPETVALGDTKVAVPGAGSKPEGLEKLDSQSSEDRKDNAPIHPQSTAPESRKSLEKSAAYHQKQTPINEYSHQNIVAQPNAKEEEDDDDGGWQTMPAYAQYDMYDDDNRLIAKENPEELEDMHGYANLGGAAKGYTRVIVDDDADSQTSMDDNTAYLFKEKTTALHDEDEAVRDPLMQMQATKNLLTEGQRVAYVGLVRLAMIEMERKFDGITEKKSRQVKKALDMQTETTKMWSQKMMVRLYGHMDINTSEQVMIEQLTDHGVIPADLTPALMQNARVKNPAAEVTSDLKEEKADSDSARPSVSSPRPEAQDEKSKSASSASTHDSLASPPPPPYEAHEDDGYEYPEPKTPSQLLESKNLDIDLRWTVLCDLFLLLVADSIYDARSRELFEVVGKYLSVDWLEICRFEKRVTDALEMQEEANKENWNEDEHMESRRKRALRKRLAFMGLATVGGGLVIGLSAGLLAPVIGAGLAAGFTTIGVAGTGSFLAGAGGTAVITSIAVTTGGTVGVRAMNRRTGAVKTFEYRPLHNNKRTNLIITLAGWMSGKADDVRLPYSTVDPIMGDIYSVLWEPEMLRSMGATINILATEVRDALENCSLTLIANRHSLKVSNKSWAAPS